MKRQAAEIMVKEHGISIVRACGLVKLSRTAWYRRPEVSTERALNGIVAKKPRCGFWKYFDRLRLNGHGWKHKRVHRV